MSTIEHRRIEGKSQSYWNLMMFLGAFVLAGLGSAYYMEHSGHWVTGMTNQIVWGMPHVFAVFLIVAASGALNVASIGSVFRKPMYKPLAPLSALLAICLLAGGLMVLVLDLGRPDRLIIAMTKLNLKSIFAWNQLLYNGFFVIVGIYIWTMMDKNMARYKELAGFFAFVWRLILTTGTGSIFGFLVARPGYDAAIMAPMFIIMSFAFGMAIYILVLMAAYSGTRRELGDYVLSRLKNLLGVFVAAVFFFVLTMHLTNLYATEHHGIERFLLLDGGVYTTLFWVVQLGLGTFLPLALIYHPTWGASRRNIAIASVLVIIGGLAQMYVIIIGGQAYPLEMFPGKEVIASTFYDGTINAYTPTLAETMLGVSGIAVSLIAVAFAIKIMAFLPASLDDKVVNPHA